MNPKGYQIMLGDFCRVKFDQNPRNFTHRHTFYEPSYVMEGSGIFQHGGIQYRLKKGDLFLANPGIFHEISSLRSKNLDIYFTSFSIQEQDHSSLSLKTNSLIERFTHSHQQHLSIQPHFGSWLAQFFKFFEKSQKNGMDFFLENIPEKIVLFMMDQLTSSPHHSSFTPERASRPLCDRVMQFIETHLSEKISLTEVARQSGRSERHLRRVFRDSQGISPIEYIQQKRVEKAAALLARPELSIKEVADRVGIWNLSQFNRLFKKIMKRSPSDFRKKSALPKKRPLESLGSVVMRTELAHSNHYQPKLKRIAVGKPTAQ